MNENLIYTSKTAELQIEHLYDVDINATFFISVDSYGFSGKYSFCLNKSDIEKIISEIIKIKSILQGSVKINDSDSDSFIFIEMVDKRLVNVSGRLGGEYEENFVVFKFQADQTIFGLLQSKFQEAFRC